MVNNPLNFFCHSLHVSKQLFEVVLEFYLGWLERKTILGVTIESDSGLDRVLLLFIIHFRQNHVGGLLVNSDLCFNNHIVNKANKCAQMIVVKLGKFKNSIS